MQLSPLFWTRQTTYKREGCSKHGSGIDSLTLSESTLLPWPTRVNWYIEGCSRSRRHIKRFLMVQHNLKSLEHARNLVLRSPLRHGCFHYSGCSLCWTTPLGMSSKLAYKAPNDSRIICGFWFIPRRAKLAHENFTTFDVANAWFSAQVEYFVLLGRACYFDLGCCEGWRDKIHEWWFEGVYCFPGTGTLIIIYW